MMGVLNHKGSLRLLPALCIGLALAAVIMGHYVLRADDERLFRREFAETAHERISVTKQALQSAAERITCIANNWRVTGMSVHPSANRVFTELSEHEMANIPGLRGVELVSAAAANLPGTLLAPPGMAAVTPELSIRNEALRQVQAGEISGFAACSCSVDTAAEMALAFPVGTTDPAGVTVTGFYVVGYLCAHELFEDATTKLRPVGVDVLLYTGPEERPVARHLSRLRTPEEPVPDRVLSAAEARSGLYYEDKITVAGHSLTLIVRPTAAYRAAHSLPSHVLLFGVGLALVLLLALYFYRQQHWRNSMLVANRQLRATSQQLQASNQQLRANEQQLQASNQQLRASEQQLEASNHQLRANEQQLKAASQQLWASEARMQYLLAASPAIIYSCDAKDNYATTFITMNLRTQFGYEPGEFIADPKFWIKHVHPEDIMQALSELSALFTRGYHSHEYRFMHQDGAYRWIRDDLVLMRNAQGDPVEIVGSWIDITERRRIEETLRAADRQAAVGQLAAGVAHEFNNVLALIRGHAQLLGHTEKSEKVSRVVAVIEEQTRRGAAVATGLMTLARPTPPKVELTPVRGLVESVIGVIDNELKARGITAKVECPAGLTVTADAGQLRQVVLNLAINAWHAMEEQGGTLTVAARRVAGGIELTVADTGHGLAPEIKARIFEPFFTTKLERARDGVSGAGLGLSVCQSIIKAHHGRISVAGKPGEGAIFTVFLPDQEVAAGAAPVKSPGADDQPLPEGLSILLVDDDPGFDRSVGDFLRAFGHTVTYFSDSVAAQSVILTREFDAGIFDYTMPRVKGTELAGQMAAAWPAAKIILATGVMDPEEIVRNMPLRDRINILSKPFDLNDLRRLLR